MIIPRELSTTLTSALNTGGKAVGIYGARQVGKTTLVRSVLAQTSWNVREITGDDFQYHSLFSQRTIGPLQELVAGFDVLFVDEAQRIPEIGLGLKLMIDSMPNLKIVFTGSSSLDLVSKVSEPLTGRVLTYTLYPVWLGELMQQTNLFDLKTRVETYLRFGMYPELLGKSTTEEKAQYLELLQKSYLLKDVFELNTIGEPARLLQLLKLLAFQVGSEVSINELATQLHISRETVNRYITLLIDSFVLFRLSGYSRNLLKEVTSMDRLYFWDLGIRNSIIGNHARLEDRNDVGALWENFLISERQKRNTYQRIRANPYFWRTYTGSEIDYIEETGGHITGYEIKWRKQHVRVPQTWLQTYPGATFQLVSQENMADFIL